MRYRHQGFTLIELILAMFITAIIGVMVTSSIFTTRVAVESIEKNVESFNDLNRFFMIFSRDIDHMITGTMSYDSTELSFSRKKIKRSHLASTHRVISHKVSYKLEDSHIIRVDETSEKEKIVLKGVNEFSLRFVDPQSVTLKKMNWLDTWNNSSPTQTKLPIAIELSIDIETMGTIVRLYQVVSS
jgi:general secretion pathway protein J